MSWGFRIISWGWQDPCTLCARSNSRQVVCHQWIQTCKISLCSLEQGRLIRKAFCPIDWGRSTFKLGDWAARACPIFREMSIWLLLLKRGQISASTAAQPLALKSQRCSGTNDRRNAKAVNSIVYGISDWPSNNLALAVRRPRSISTPTLSVIQALRSYG